MVSPSGKKTAFVIGTGPSLRDIDVAKLKDYDTMSFNRSYISYDQWGFDPTYYMCIDAADLAYNAPDINKLITKSDIKHFFLAYGDANMLINRCANPPDNKPMENMYFHTNASEKVTRIYDFDHIDFYQMYNFWSVRPELKNPDLMNEITTKIWPNAGAMGARVLQWLGYEEIALVGCDARYRDDKESNKHIVKNNSGKTYTSTENYDLNHYCDEYFGEGVSFGSPDQKEHLLYWSWLASSVTTKEDWLRYSLKGAYQESMSRDLAPSSVDGPRQATITPSPERYDHFKIYSCTKDSNANKYFQYIDFEDFLAGKR